MSQSKQTPTRRTSARSYWLMWISFQFLIKSNIYKSENQISNYFEIKSRRIVNTHHGQFVGSSVLIWVAIYSGITRNVINSLTFWQSLISCSISTFYRCRAQKDFLIKVSSIGDPSKAFSVFFPVILGLNPVIGIKFLTSTVICEWLNQVLKW